MYASKVKSEIKLSEAAIIQKKYKELQKEGKQKKTSMNRKEDSEDDLLPSSGVAFDLLLFLDDSTAIAAQSDKDSTARIIGLHGYEEHCHKIRASLTFFPCFMAICLRRSGCQQQWWHGMQSMEPRHAPNQPSPVNETFRSAYEHGPQ
jgi:hypothetical protein